MIPYNASIHRLRVFPIPAAMTRAAEPAYVQRASIVRVRGSDLLAVPPALLTGVGARQIASLDGAFDLLGRAIGDAHPLNVRQRPLPTTLAVLLRVREAVPPATFSNLGSVRSVVFGHAGTAVVGKSCPAMSVSRRTFGATVRDSQTAALRARRGKRSRGTLIGHRRVPSVGVTPPAVVAARGHFAARSIPGRAH